MICILWWYNCVPKIVSVSRTVLEITQINENSRWRPGGQIWFLIGCKFKLDLYLLMIHPHTKYHFNISNGSWDNAQKPKSKMTAWQPYWILDQLNIWTGPVSYNDTTTYQISFKYVQRFSRKYMKTNCGKLTDGQTDRQTEGEETCSLKMA